MEMTTAKKVFKGWRRASNQLAKELVCDWCGRCGDACCRFQAIWHKGDDAVCGECKKIIEET